MTRIFCLLMTLLAIKDVLCGEPNPPNFPSTVRVFEASDTDISKVVNEAFSKNGGHVPANHGQFSGERYAFLFKPGNYSADVPVGYYTSIYGLGESPNDVIFNGDRGVYAEEGDYNYQGGSLCTFWRSAENFRTTSSHDWQVGKGMIWAVSQASPLRRVVVDHDLNLFEYQPPATAAGYSSGGYIANSKISGDLRFGSQQQFCVRNVDLGKEVDVPPVWNGVFVGCSGSVPTSHCGTGNNAHPIVTAKTSPKIAEKPFITSDLSGRFILNVPKLQTDSIGSNFDQETTKIDFENVYVTQLNDDAETINTKLAEGLDVVISPGIYYLSTSLRVTRSEQVILGLGMATLVTTSDEPCIVVPDAFQGVRIAGLLLEAKSETVSSLLMWGIEGGGNISNPGVLSDVFARNGVFTNETESSSIDTMLRIASDSVIIDNTWLWRADHDSNGAANMKDNHVNHGLYVKGDDVFAYGLAVEHTLQDLTIWDGDRGQVFFYQSELPYGVDQESFGDKYYVGYRVGSNVTSHNAYGVGVYQFFRDHAVTVKSGIQVPDALVSSFVSPFTVFLNGLGKIEHVINNLGDTTASGVVTAYVCESSSH